MLSASTHGQLSSAADAKSASQLQLSPSELKDRQQKRSKRLLARESAAKFLGDFGIVPTALRWIVSLYNAQLVTNSSSDIMLGDVFSSKDALDRFLDSLAMSNGAPKVLVKTTVELFSFEQLEQVAGIPLCFYVRLLTFNSNTSYFVCYECCVGVVAHCKLVFRGLDLDLD